MIHQTPAVGTTVRSNYDVLLAGDGNDVLLDGDGVSNAAGGAGNDVLTIALRKGWRDANGQARFAGLAAGYGNDVVEMNPHSLAMIVNGAIRQDVLADFGAV